MEDELKDRKKKNPCRLVESIRSGPESVRIPRDREYGVVLEGGGAKGAFQIGAWRALSEAGIRCELDARGEKIGYKIREAQMEKVPYMLVVGEKEMENKTVSVRSRKEGDKGAVSFSDFISGVKAQIASRACD
mgnify:CR=1 FL=1